MSTHRPKLALRAEASSAPQVYRQAQIDTLKAVLARAQNGATGRALLAWVYEELVELETAPNDE